MYTIYVSPTGTWFTEDEVDHNYDDYLVLKVPNEASEETIETIIEEYYSK